jgi:hypothetical protein
MVNKSISLLKQTYDRIMAVVTAIENLRGGKSGLTYFPGVGLSVNLPPPTGKSRPGGAGGSSAEQLWVWIDSARTQPGEYKAYFATIKSGTVVITGSTAFTNSDMFDHDTGSEELTAVNLFEANLTSHAITDAPQTAVAFPCWLSGRVDGSGKRVVYFMGINSYPPCVTGEPF